MTFSALGWGNYLLFVVLAVVIVLSSVTISYIVDTLGKRTKFSGALVAGTLVAFVSSLPEFTSSLTSVLANQDFSGALGNLIGGNIFRTFMLGVICIMFIIAMKKARTSKIQVCLIIIQSLIVVLNIVMMIEFKQFGKFGI
jgi:cation:H+ antiporter